MPRSARENQQENDPRSQFPKRQGQPRHAPGRRSLSPPRTPRVLRRTPAASTPAAPSTRRTSRRSEMASANRCCATSIAISTAKPATIMNALSITGTAKG